MRTWIAFRIKGRKPEQHTGLIHAANQIEAELEAYRIFNATTADDQRRVYVIEKL